jgi:hypothetical protein
MAERGKCQLGKAPAFCCKNYQSFDTAGVAYCEQFSALAKAPVGNPSGTSLSPVLTDENNWPIPELRWRFIAPACLRRVEFRIITMASFAMPEFEEILVDVWRQTLVDGAKYVLLGTGKYPVRETSRQRLKQVDFQFEGHEVRGLEQNPDTKSRWAAMARQGKKVMQLLEGGQYVAVVVDGKMKTYG